MNKVLTLIIPSYNMEAYLERCLSSLVVDEGRMRLFEALVINDGSSDRTSEIGHAYEARYPDTFRVIDKSNGHYGSCVNRGLAEARGTYVKVLDADDRFAAAFAGYLDFLQEARADLILTDSVIIYPDDSEHARSSFPIPAREVHPVDILLEKGIHGLGHVNITYRTDIFRKLEYRQTEGISYTDLEWSSIPVCGVSSVAYYPEILYRYQQGRDGQSVDIAYRKDHMWMENQVVLGLAGKYEALKGSIPPANAAQLRAIVTSFAEQVYFHYLLNFPKYLPQSDLAGFDRALGLASREIYDLCVEAEDVNVFGTFHFVRNYRKRGTRKHPAFFYYDLCRALGTLYKSIKR